jgi:hypothetical protein
MVVGAMVELGVVVADLHTMFQDLVQDKATAAAAVKHLIKAALLQTATVMLDLAATVLLTQAVVVAAVDHIMVVADQASLLYDIN